MIEPPVDAILLAAGQGKRMGGDRPKVLFEAAGKPMIRWVLEACRDAGVRRCVLVVGYKQEMVRSALDGWDRCEFVVQGEQLGTGHAAAMAAPHFDESDPVDTFVLAGDMPLIRADVLRELLDAHRTTEATTTLGTAIVDDPTGYGRIVRDAGGKFDRIVEQKDGTPHELAIREINPSFYVFRSDRLFTALREVDNTNQSREYYLTDVPGISKRKGWTVTVLDSVPAEDVMGANTPDQLAAVDRLLRSRHDLTPSPVGETG